MKRPLAAVFLGALAIRWLYATVLYSTMGMPGLIAGPDSESYISDGARLMEAIAGGGIHGWQWLGLDPVTMPLANWLFAVPDVLGSWGSLAYVLMQGMFDAGTCLLIYGIARELNPRYALPAAIAAAINPTQIVLSGLVLTDTPFVFFVAAFLFAATRWLRQPAMRWAVLLGLALGAAMLTRVLIVPWTPALLIFLLIVAALRRQLSIRCAVQLAATAAIFALCVAPILWRNVAQYGAWSLTSQQGLHLAGWVAPLVKEAKDGTPWGRTYDEMQRRTRERYGAPSDNPFVQSTRLSTVAREELATLGVAAMAKAWVVGAAINLGSPGIILSPPVYSLPRTGFYGTAGSSTFEKIDKFLFHSESALYAWILLIGIAGLAGVRLVQACGVGAVLWCDRQWAIILLLAGWCGFILAINGPVGSPKYRLPMEPVLAILTGAGFVALRKRYETKRGTSPVAPR